MTALLFALPKLDALPIQMGCDLKLKFFLWKLNIENKKIQYQTNKTETFF